MPSWSNSDTGMWGWCGMGVCFHHIAPNDRSWIDNAVVVWLCIRDPNLIILFLGDKYMGLVPWFEIRERKDQSSCKLMFIIFFSLCRQRVTITWLITKTPNWQIWKIEEVTTLLCNGTELFTVLGLYLILLTVNVCVLYNRKLNIHCPNLLFLLNLACGPNSMVTLIKCICKIPVYHICIQFFFSYISEFVIVLI